MIDDVVEQTRDEHIDPSLRINGSRPPDLEPRLLQEGLDELFLSYGDLAAQGRIDRGETEGALKFVDDMIAFTSGESCSETLKMVMALCNKRAGRPKLVAAIHFFKHSGDIIKSMFVRARLSEEMNRTSETTRNSEMKLDQAAFQQRMAQLLYHVSFLPETDVRYQFISLVWDMTMLMCTRYDRTTTSSAAGELLCGIRAQAAFMRLYHDAGYAIIAPEADTESSDRSVRSSSEWELRNSDLKGVDFIAISPDGEILFFDSKGKIVEKDASIDKRLVSERAIEFLRRKLKQEGRSLNHPGVQMLLASNQWRMSGWEIRLPLSDPHVRLSHIEEPYASEVLQYFDSHIHPS